MDIHGIAMAFLMQLPALGIGFFAGALFMRENYLRIIKWQKRIIARQNRNMARMIGPWD